MNESGTVMEVRQALYSPMPDTAVTPSGITKVVSVFPTGYSRIWVLPLLYSTPSLEANEPLFGDTVTDSSPTDSSNA